MRSALVAVIGLSLACSSKSEPVRTPAPDLDPTLDLGRRHATPVDAAVIAAEPAPVKPAPAPVAASAGVSFADEARHLFRIAACGGDAAGRAESITAIAGADEGHEQRVAKLAKLVDGHCKNLLERMAKFRGAYLDKHRAWFDAVVPKDVPRTVVYPFGGGDLLSALVAFPDATETTTISLEYAGDPRRITTLRPEALAGSLGAVRVEIGGLLSVGSNTSLNLSAQQRNELPGQVVSHLIGLATAGFEPVEMRYFTLGDDGAIRYLDQAAIDVIEGDRRRARGKPLKGDWESPAFSEAFSHVEIQYRRPGTSELRVHRHFGWNLADDHLAIQPQLLRHLEAKGKVSVLVKGASYLLQRPNFSKIRGYLLGHLAWMLSDSTGIPPSFAGPAGMVQETYGSYSGAFLEGSRDNRADRSFVELWRTQPRRRLGFRFGYVDAAGAGHLVVTRPK